MPNYISIEFLLVWWLRDHVLSSNFQAKLYVETCYESSSVNRDRVMVFNATFINITATLWWSVLLIEGTRENHRPIASH